jgi:MoxR-like ATPase
MDDRQSAMTTEAATDAIAAVVERIEEAAVVDRAVLEAVLSAVLARGHVLIEDVPGTGKTVTARTLAEALGLEFSRIQFTPDLLPSDVTGSTVYDERAGEFTFAKGPVFGNLVLADEINRAPPKTQAALLEAMEERQVTADGETYPLPEPFVVVATQNPIEQEGTFRLPEAQRDRFSVKTSLGYPDVAGEMELLDKRASRRSIAPTVDPVSDPDTVLALQDLAEDVRVDEKVRRYIVDLARATREDPRTEVGVSPRGIQRVFEAVRARAVIDGRDYAAPEDVKRLAEAAMAHRLVLTTEASVEGVDPRTVVADALDRVAVPGVSPGEAGGAPPDAGGTDAPGGPPGEAGGRPPGEPGNPPESGRNPDARPDRPPESGGNPDARSDRPPEPNPDGPPDPDPDGSRGTRRDGDPDRDGDR